MQLCERGFFVLEVVVGSGVLVGLEGLAGTPNHISTIY